MKTWSHWKFVRDFPNDIRFRLNFRARLWNKSYTKIFEICLPHLTWFKLGSFQRQFWISVSLKELPAHHAYPPAVQKNSPFPPPLLPWLAWKRNSNIPASAWMPSTQSQHTQNYGKASLHHTPPPQSYLSAKTSLWNCNLRHWLANLQLRSKPNREGKKKGNTPCVIWQIH